MRFSLRVNNDLSVGDTVDIARAAEAAGFDQLWVSHDLFLRSAPVLVAAAAQATTTLELGIGVFNPYSQHPAEIAMTAAALQELSEGRFLLGLSAGAGDFLSWIGIDQDRPLARTREAIGALRVLLNGAAPASGDVRDVGGGWSPQARLRFPGTPPPIYLGAMGPGMLALAGEVADGALPLLFPPEHYATAAALIKGGCGTAGRDATEVDIAACIWCSVDDDADRARNALAEKIAYYGPSFSPFLLQRAGLSAGDFDRIRTLVDAGDLRTAVADVTPRMLSLGVAGTGADVLGRCRTLVSMGARHLSFGPPLGPDPLAAVRRLGWEVLTPLARGRTA